MKKLILLAALAIACCPPAALAQADADAKKCVAGSESSDLTVLYCTRAIDLKEVSGADLGKVFFSRALALQAGNNFDRAFSDFEVAVRLDPQNAVAFYNLGNNWLAKGDPDRAIASYDAAILINPKYDQALGNRGTAWHMKGDVDRAIADYDTAIRANRRYLNALYNRGRAWLDKGEMDRAIADFDAALRINPTHAAALSNRGRAWQSKGDTTRALADYEAALRIDPKATDALFNRGVSRFIQGEYALADQDFSRLDTLGLSAYGAVWRYLGKARSGADPGTPLARDLMFIVSHDWPEPVVRFYQGELTQEQTLAAAADQDPKKAQYQRCATDFFIAQWHLARGQSAPARALLEAAQAGCGKSTLEYVGVTAELKRMPP